MAEKEEPRMRYSYTVLHMPTGTRHERQIDQELNRLEFLTLLNAWNQQMAGIWQYWSCSA